MAALRVRQVHLDFHTSPQIPEVGADFDATEFARTLQGAHVNSVTVFAKCHHGYSYYPTKVGTVHPHLQRDLLGEMIEALHGAGIRAPVYTTLVWDELAWATHPEWRHLTPDGRAGGPAGTPLRPGWKNLCLNTYYGDYVIAQIEEVMQLYPGDGWFVDIVRYGAEPCVCATCLTQMQAEGVDPTNPGQRRAFALAAERGFLARCSAAIRDLNPQQSIFYNARLNVDRDPALGNRPEVQEFSHFEIESLPGGFWGYDHFPLTVRYFQTFGVDLLGMTGRFHTSWGDFGGIRNQAALAYEAFLALAHGAAISIGDQLHPRGRLNEVVYRRIGEVYAEVERREPWCQDTSALPEIAVMTATTGGASHEGQIHEADRGALHILEQGKHQFQYVDTGCDLATYAVVVLPDEIPVGPALALKLRSYVAGGGRLLITGNSGLDPATGEFALADLMGVQCEGPAEFAPDYLLVDPALGEGIEPAAHVCELPGLKVRAAEGTTVLARAGAPYFNRTWEHFCSHQYSPLAHATDDPIVTQKGGVIYVARPLFREYAQTARRVHKQVLENCLRRLLPAPRVGANGLPSTAVVTVRAQGSDLIVHLLHYVHQRRGAVLDVIEDVLPLVEVPVSIRVENMPVEVRLVPEDRPLAWRYAEPYVQFTVPRIDGYQIVAIEAG